MSLEPTLLGRVRACLVLKHHRREARLLANRSSNEPVELPERLAALPDVPDAVQGLVQPHVPPHAVDEPAQGHNEEAVGGAVLQRVLELAAGEALHDEVGAFGVQAPAVLAAQPLRRLLHLAPRLFGQPGDADDEAGEGAAAGRAAGGGGGAGDRGGDGGGGGGGRGGGLHPGEQQPGAAPAGDHLHAATRHRRCGRRMARRFREERRKRAGGSGSRGAGAGGLDPVVVLWRAGRAGVNGDGDDSSASAAGARAGGGPDFFGPEAEERDLETTTAR